MSGPSSVETRLHAGSLRVDVTQADLPFDEICGFASRSNRKRAFLFVSKVLGKHYPVRPARMRSVYRALAAKLGRDLPGPVLLIAMAETATGLGQGVYEEYRKHTGRDDALFIHSTRYRLRNKPAIEFREPHSHAPDHIVYEPIAPLDASLFHEAATLVMVDDEMSTGQSFLNLAQAYQRINPALRHIRLVVITDWLGERRAELLARMPARAAIASLVSGSYRFTPSASFAPAGKIDVTGNGASKDAYLRANHGRLGQREVPRFEAACAAAAASIAPGERVLVLGTGEFIFPPFRVAEHLAALGHDIHYQSTTRSPMLLGNDIASRLEFQDNYHDGMPNFVYNVVPDRYDKILVCYETTPLPAGHRLPEMLGAKPIFF